MARILRNTWNHIAGLSYPGSLTVYCLDDVGSSSVAEMAEEFGFIYLSRPDKGWMKKSGNLLFAYQHSAGEVVALFDADFCPRPNFLLELLPYLDANPRAGIVQSAQYFRVDRQQNWIERGAAQVQEFFYRACQVSRGAKYGAICCGTNAVYRRAALDQNGGMTLVQQGEDMRTGFDLARRGWLLTYVPLNLAMGLSPCDMSSYFKQQYRWCTGSLRLLSERVFWEATLPARAKLCYLAGFNYYLQSASYLFVLPALIISLLVFYPQHFNIVDYEVILPAIAVMIVAYPLWHRCRFGPAAWSIRVVQQWTYVFAIFDFIREADDSLGCNRFVCEVGRHDPSLRPVQGRGRRLERAHHLRLGEPRGLAPVGRRLGELRLRDRHGLVLGPGHLSGHLEPAELTVTTDSPAVESATPALVLATEVPARAADLRVGRRWRRPF